MSSYNGPGSEPIVKPEAVAASTILPDHTGLLKNYHKSTSLPMRLRA